MAEVSEISKERQTSQKVVNLLPVRKETSSQERSHSLKVNILNLYLYLHDNIENLVISTDLFQTVKERSVNWKILESEFCNFIVNKGIRIFINPDFQDLVDNTITSEFKPTYVNQTQSMKLRN